MCAHLSGFLKSTPSVSKESALCVKSPGKRRTPADDLATISKTVGSSSARHSGAELNHETGCDVLIGITKTATCH